VGSVPICSCNRDLNAKEVGAYSSNRTVKAEEICMYSGKRNTTDVGVYSCNRALKCNKFVMHGSMAAIGLQMENGIVSAIEHTAPHKVRIC
jgi:hypothetical protein